MPTYKFTAKTQQDLTRIIHYTMEMWGQVQATTYIDGLESRAESLAQTPKIAKPCPNIYAGLRCFPYESHVLYFMEAPHGITIVRVLHEGMNPALHLTGKMHKTLLARSGLDFKCG